MLNGFVRGIRFTSRAHKGELLVTDISDDVIHGIKINKDGRPGHRNVKVKFEDVIEYQLSLLRDVEHSIT